jgi:hypothetical protein
MVKRYPSPRPVGRKRAGGGASPNAYHPAHLWLIDEFAVRFRILVQTRTKNEVRAGAFGVRACVYDRVGISILPALSRGSRYAPCERLTIVRPSEQVFTLYRMQGRLEKKVRSSTPPCSLALADLCLASTIPTLLRHPRSRTLNASTRNTDLKRLQAEHSWAQRQLTDCRGLSQPMLSQSGTGGIQGPLKEVQQ